MDVMHLAAANLLQPAVLFFVLGFGAGFARSDLAVPEGVVKTMALYLMLCIGFRGGVEAAKAGLSSGFGLTAVVALVLSFGLPLLAFAALRLYRLDRPTRAATAAHYGSVSAVTFAAASEYLHGQGVAFAGYMAAVVALMETPAIVSGLLLAGRRSGGETGPKHTGELVREVLLNGTVVLLLGAFVIGALTGERGLKKIDLFVNPLFQGVLCLFLLEMGLVAARRLTEANRLTWPLAGFGIAMPLASMLIALGLCALVGVPPENRALLATLAASASYIAVPAAMRLALPDADAGVSLPLSIGITFPFNIVVGIPLYLWMAQRLA